MGTLVDNIPITILKTDFATHERGSPTLFTNKPLELGHRKLAFPMC